MNTQIVEIQPRELKFRFELKKQSSCAVHLANVTDQYVAFKVKTTSPKKYCVRPNVGIIKPKSTSDFTVTMQAQKSAPSDMICKDKFLIQSTVVPFGTNEEEITPSMFTRDGHKYIEETKLRVILIKEPDSSLKVPGAGDVPVEEDPSYSKLSPKEADLPVYSDNATIKQEHAPHEASIATDKLHNEAETVPQAKKLYAMPEMIETVNNTTEESRELGFKNNTTPVSAGDEDFNSKNEELVTRQLKEAEETKLKLTKALEDMRSTVSTLNYKLVEAESTIEKLKQERNSTIQVKETLKREMASTRRESSGDGRIVRAGFPPLFVCMVALIALTVGSLFRA